MKKFSIVIPIHNESEIIKKQLSSLISELDSAYKGRYEILLMENGSTDGTQKIARDLANKYAPVRSFRTHVTSVGRAIRAGIKATKHDIVFRFDIEFWSVNFIEKALPLLRRYDVIIGSKNLPSSFDQRPAARRLVSQLRNKLLRMIFSVWFTDGHGIKAFNKKRVAKYLLVSKSKNHFLEHEFILRAFYSGVKIKEIPTAIAEVRKSRFPLAKRVYQAAFEFTKLLLIKNRIQSYGLSTQR